MKINRHENYTITVLHLIVSAEKIVYDWFESTNEICQ